MNAKKATSTEKLVLIALFTSIVAILAYVGGFIKIGGLASISLTLIPIVVGSAICGPWVGAWLGFVSGLFFLFNYADSAFWYTCFFNCRDGPAWYGVGLLIQ